MLSERTIAVQDVFLFEAVGFFFVFEQHANKCVPVELPI